jgi:UDP-N-acetylmuramoyl-tripeptide--D-alanyl-D-alanine ligase
VTIPFSVRQAASWSGGRLVRGDPQTLLSGVSIDTRSLQPGCLFVAIRGPRHDAHDFLDRARAAGAAALLVERGRPLPADAGELPAVEVEDTTVALARLAAGHRAGYRGALVAITGSNGKTTTKEMCASILSVRAPCLRNRGNLNNQFGLPLTLLERDAEHAAVVLEVGMNHRGEIAPLAEIARPTVAVITNVGTAHIENLGSREAIALEKGELVAALSAEGCAVLNADDPLALAQGRRSPARVLRFGLARDAEVRAEEVAALGERGYAFELCTPAGRRRVHVAGLGETTVANALAASAAALAAGATLDEIASGLAGHRPVGGRMERMTLPRNIILINDTYNANPQSMEVALRTLTSLKGGARAVAVLGDMGELGESAVQAHRDTGRLVAELGLDLLFVLGRHAEETARAALEAGLHPSRVHVGKDHESLGACVRERLQGNDWVLVKGSRSMHMERVVEILASREPA